MLPIRFSLRTYVFCILSLLTAFFIPSYLYSYEDILEKIAGSKYIFCVDGGASKTDLKVLNEKGEELALFKSLDAEAAFTLKGASTNITVYHEREVKKTLFSLIKNIYVGEEQIPAENIIKESAFIGCFAGSGREKGKKSLLHIIEKIGFPKNKIGLFSDAALCLELIQDNGGILIAGTGSICFMREKGIQKRFGGLGYRLADEGSGYMMGIAGIKAAIESEHSPTNPTSLARPIKELFEVQKATDLIEVINKNMETPAKIGSVAEIVFREALNGDERSLKIVNDSSKQLGALLAKAVKKTNQNKPIIYLIGGLFQSKQADQFIKDIYSSSEMRELSQDERPLLVNISNKMIPALIVEEALQSNSTPYAKSLASLPITSRAPCKEFKEKFHLAFTSTEKPHPEAINLSQIFHENQIEGLELLQSLDQSVLMGAEEFIENHLEDFHRLFLNVLQKKGRIFFVGSGSSGRIALDLAAKWREFFVEKAAHLPGFLKSSVQGIIAGGPYSFVKAREGFEDSTLSGYETLKDANFNSSDIAILISASGSAYFNIGAAEYASESGGACYYFYNSKKIPQRTQLLFEKDLAKPVLIDIGPQSITGSTRLQGSSLAEFCWGSVLESIVEKFNYGDSLDPKKVGNKLLQNLQSSWETVSSVIPEISKIVDLEKDVLLNPEANFWKARDESKQGFITFLSSDDSLREIMIDTTETSPTFSTNPPRCKKSEVGKKRAEYRAFLAGNLNNSDAWQNLLGHKLGSRELKDISGILLSSTEEGYGAYINRIETEGNLLIGVLKSTQKREKALELISELRMAKYRGLKVAAILLEEKKNSFQKEAYQMENFCNGFVFLPEVPRDCLGIISSLALKQTLNLISNATMIQMNKLYGNTMIDVNPTNNKLIDRSIRIIQQIYSEHHPEKDPFNYETLFQFVTRANEYKKLVEKHFSAYVPPCTKLVLTMLEKNCDILEAVNFLKENNENIHKLYEE